MFKKLGQHLDTYILPGDFVFNRWSNFVSQELYYIPLYYNCINL